MERSMLDLFQAYAPLVHHDENDPFPLRTVGCTRFETPGTSLTVPGLSWDPQAQGARQILEYALYYDYDIQHLYDLEHVWVAVGEDGTVVDCWSSFHGMVLRPWGLPRFFRLQGTHPVVYSEPGKHALMPDPSLFGLHPEYPACCDGLAGGGLLVPPMLKGKMHTDIAQDAAIRRYIREHFRFIPKEHYTAAPWPEELFLEAPELLDRIPTLVAAQLEKIRQEFPW